MIKVTNVMLFWCSINTQSLDYVKSSSISYFINDKSRNLQKLLRYLSEIVSSTFKVGTAGCGVLFVSPDHTGLSVVFPSIFFCFFVYI